MSKKALAKWVAKANAGPTGHLNSMLDYAASHYGRHMDWFLKHRDMGIKSQAVILTAEFAVLSLYFSGSDSRSDAIPPFLAYLSLAMIAVFSVVLAIASSRSCRQSFKASLEHAVLVTKCAWAMGWADPIALAEMPMSDAPVHDDERLYVTRYWQDAIRDSRTAEPVQTTQDFVMQHMKDKSTTCYLGILTIWLFCTGAVLLAVFGSVAVCCT